MKTGRKSKYADAAPIILELIGQGHTYKEACRQADISYAIFLKWKADKKEFFDAIKKVESDFRTNMVGTLEKNLFRRANGYEVTETKSEYSVNEEGRLICTKETKTVKELAPDTGALIFALTNMAPERWQNKQKQEISGEVSGLTIVVDDKDDENLVSRITDV